MPNYKYNCKDCGHSFKIKATMVEKNEGLDSVCPECNSENVSRSFGNVGVVTDQGESGASGPGCIPGSGCCG